MVPGAPPTVRRACEAERPQLVALWERSVRATHGFLGERDVSALRSAVAAELASRNIDWWVLAENGGEPIAFMGLAPGCIEGLFVDPAHHRKGVGTALVAHAQRLDGGSWQVAAVLAVGGMLLGLGGYLVARATTRRCPSCGERTARLGRHCESCGSALPTSLGSLFG